MTGAARNIDRNRHARTFPHVGTVSVSIRSVRPVLMFIAARGHDGSAFLKDHGISPMIFRDPEARLPHAVAVRLWQAACQLTNDSDLGLHVAEGIRAGNFGALDYAVRTSETLGVGLQRLSRYHHFLHDAAEVKLTVHRDRAVLSHRLPVPGGPPRAVSEFVIAGWLVTSRQATGANWIPLQVRFPHAAPDNTSEHRRVFGCSLEFGHERSELVFSRDLLDMPLLKADADLQAILEAQVVATLQKLPKGEATTDAVRRYLAGELCKGQPTLEQIAPRLHMSPRTLHRRLDEEGTSFRRVLTEVRRELAGRHLIDRQLAISEIAFLLGFSEASAFHRAFKRWTGHAPLAYRELTPPPIRLERHKR
jgi:AraC-like DNA-binding protein